MKHSLCTCATALLLAAGLSAAQPTPAAPPTAGVEAEANTPPATPHPSLEELTDAECLALQRYIQQCSRACLLANADYYERRPQPDQAHHQLLALAAVPTDELPEDFRDYLRHSYALSLEILEQMLPLQEAMEKLERPELSLIEEALRCCENNLPEPEAYAQHPCIILSRQFSQLETQRREQQEEWNERSPRAAALFPMREPYLPHQLSRDCLYPAPPVGEGEREDFIRNYPRTKNPDDWCRLEAAWNRHLAATPLPAMDAATARHQLHRRAMHRFDILLPDVYVLPWGMSSSFTHILPQDSSSGYSWKMTSSVPEDAENVPAKVTWRCLPLEQWKAEYPAQARNIRLPYGTTEVNVLEISPWLAGEICLQLTFSHPADDKPLFSHKLTIRSKAEEEPREQVENTKPQEAP